MTTSSHRIVPHAPLTPWLLAGFSAVLGVLVVALVAGPANLRKVFGATDAVAHTQAVRAALQELLTTTIDAETGQRGFIITGDESYLEPYARSQRTIENHVVRVRSLTADNAAQQEDLERVVAAVNRRLEPIERSIGLRRDSGFGARSSPPARQEADGRDADDRGAWRRGRRRCSRRAMRRPCAAIVSPRRSDS
jgi:CHASE3 domain sensor protein